MEGFLNICLYLVLLFLTLMQLEIWWYSRELKQFLVIDLGSLDWYQFVDNFCDCFEFPGELRMRLRITEGVQFLMASGLLCCTASFGT